MKTWEDVIDSIPNHRLLFDGAELILEFNKYTNKYNVICQDSISEDFYWCKEFDTLKQAKEFFYNEK